MKKNTEDDSKDIRRKKFQEKTDKINRSEQTLNHAMKKEFKRKKLQMEEDDNDWENWQEYYKN
jgi:hypothetical protein